MAGKSFEAWWTQWWSENAIAADNTEEVCKANAQKAFGAGYMACMDDKVDKPQAFTPTAKQVAFDQNWEYAEDYLVFGYVCKRCGVAVSNYYTDEHDKFHQELEARNDSGN